jgi:putative SOS response-associated peptidase YedK
MCGRYTLTRVDGRLVAERFGIIEEIDAPETLGRFNVCPTEDVLVVAPDGPRVARWGLVPPWAKSVGEGPLLINARSETVASKGVFSRLLERPERRCLVVADGWYEWLRPEKKGEPRIPFHYTVDGGELFAFAGLWDVVKLDGAWVVSTTLLTTVANEVCASVHDRMPCVIADPDIEAAWLDGAELDVLEPLPAQRTSAAPANPAVNKAGVEGAELLSVAP